MSNRLLGCYLSCGLLSLAGCSRGLVGEGAGITSREPAHATLPASQSNQQASGVAVVELFTSEGCSSCPPADRVLAKLAARATSDSLPLYPLSFHVDYWNHLGWRDRFSDERFSDRQRHYSALSGSGGTYTPQIVVNGEAESVGSNADQIDALIAAALQRQPRTQIELSARRSERGIEVSYRVSGETRRRVLNLALVEPRADSQVENGENAGERLAHVNVVRLFTSLPLSEGISGSWSARPGPELARGPLGVVAFAEAASQRDISGAAALEL